MFLAFTHFCPFSTALHKIPIIVAPSDVFSTAASVLLLEYLQTSHTIFTQAKTLFFYPFFDTYAIPQNDHPSLPLSNFPRLRPFFLSVTQEGGGGQGGRSQGGTSWLLLKYAFFGGGRTRGSRRCNREMLGKADPRL